MEYLPTGKRKRRDAILGLDTTRDTFSLTFTLAVLDALKKANLLDLEQTQNDSPSVRAILEFMRNNPRFVATGYVIGSHREDCRVSIEGLEYRGPVTVELCARLVEFARHADELTIEAGYLRAWWD